MYDGPTICPRLFFRVHGGHNSNNINHGMTFLKVTERSENVTLAIRMRG